MDFEKYIDLVKKVFFSPHFWLPPGKTWNQFQSTNQRRLAEFNDVLMCWLFVPTLLLTRHVFEKHIFNKITEFFGIKEEKKKDPGFVSVLVDAYRSNPSCKWSRQEIVAFSKQLKWSEEKVENWFQAKKRFERPTLSEKFGESAWRSLFFTLAFTFGLYSHWDQDWLWDIKLCWANFPQPLLPQSYWYVVFSFSNYSSWSISHFTDVPRKDSGLMILHHIVTILLIATAWIGNYHRLTVIFLLTFDIGDILLETSKALKYLGFKLGCQVTFVLFSIVWMITRVYLVLWYILPSLFSDSPMKVSQEFPFLKGSCTFENCDLRKLNFNACHFGLCLSAILVALMFYWTCLIVKVYFVFFLTGKMEDDTISDDEELEKD